MRRADIELASHGGARACQPSSVRVIFVETLLANLRARAIWGFAFSFAKPAWAALSGFCHRLVLPAVLGAGLAVALRLAIDLRFAAAALVFTVALRVFPAVLVFAAVLAFAAVGRADFKVAFFCGALG